MRGAGERSEAIFAPHHAFVEDDNGLGALPRIEMNEEARLTVYSLDGATLGTVNPLAVDVEAGVELDRALVGGGIESLLEDLRHCRGMKVRWKWESEDGEESGRGRDGDAPFAAFEAL